MSIFALPTAFFLTLVAILVLRPLASKFGLVDKPGGRKTHSKDTPLIGGLGIYLGLLLGCLFNAEVMAHYQPLLLISSLLLLTGLVDDYFPLSAIARLGIQIVAAWLMYTLGENQLVSLGKLFGDSELFLGRYSMLMTIFATVGVINAINMIDGMDGLSGGMVIICLALLGISASVTGNNPALLSFTLIAICCLAAFLVLNFRAAFNKPALIYLGDSGSTLLGFILAWLLIESSQGGGDRVIPATVALWYLAIPLMDTVYLFIARPLSGKSPFEPGTDHLHHLLAAHGISKDKVVLLLYGGGLLLGMAGLCILYMPDLERFSLYLFIGIFLLYSFIMRKEKQQPAPPE
ncbi:MAG: undecaprenyl/decaprenyl-phosphate alpha-N-acetylglucosaminyl 1-phosphate transferase [Gammaproteobacteria bacterium]|jgi:UDP-GlcNAc:undecaprenyl-phosphate/decaprenyl-phosphate GlcNAc-1-phosphate transferase|nr:undecaprenyl/decaprenyl-phosphate alpha-N-acetylglucosaminyl 1-phosphate transferase [Gammaproteobacteria bacterium]